MRPDFVFLFRVLLAVALAIGVDREVDYVVAIVDQFRAELLLQGHPVCQSELRPEPREQVERVRPARAARHLRVHIVLVLSEFDVVVSEKLCSV